MGCLFIEIAIIGSKKYAFLIHPKKKNEFDNFWSVALFPDHGFRVGGEV